MIDDKTTPLVSIVIPCYKGARFLSQAIESCLGQVYRNVEVVVVDDASPDECAVIAGEYAGRDKRVRLVRRSINGGMSRAFNSGFEVAGGELMTRLAQDDWFRQDAISIMANGLLENPDAGLAYCNTQIVDENGKNVMLLETQQPEHALLPANRMGLCVMWRRSVWEKIGGFEPRCDTADDYDYWLRASHHFRFVKCSDEAPLFFRYHPGQGSVLYETRQKIAGSLALTRYWGTRMREKPLNCFCWYKTAGSAIKYCSWKLRLAVFGENVDFVPADTSGDTAGRLREKDRET